jgi:predicted amidophosphoribosyltransferase
MKQRLLQALCDGACALSRQLKSKHVKVPRISSCCGYQVPTAATLCYSCRKPLNLDAIETKTLCLAAPPSWA